MTLNKLIKTASRDYPNNLIQLAHSGKDGIELGDGLASFVASELKETFDKDASSKEQLDKAIDVMGRAISELTGVRNNLLQERFH